jgi:hypothetical protein
MQLSFTYHSYQLIYNLAYDYELRESVPMSPLLTSTLDSDWLPFSDEALLIRPDWSDTDFFDLGLYSVTTTVTLFTVTSHF